MAKSEPLLQIGGLNAFYGDSHVLFDIDLDVHERQGVALLGRNGAGKSTLMKSALDAGPTSTGTLRFGGQSLDGVSTERRARLGLMLVPEDRRIFPHLTVAQNLELAAHACVDKARAMTVAQVCERFPMLAPLTGRLGFQLSGGQQQLLAVARGLVPHPRLLLLDEPAEGLAPVIVQQLAEEVRAVREREQLTLLLAEQNLGFARRCTDYVYLLDSGHIVFRGSWVEFDAQPDLKTRYLAV